LLLLQRCWRRFVANRTSNQLAMLILRQKVQRAAAARSAARKAVRKVAAAAISSAGTVTLGPTAEFDSGDHVEYLVDWWPEARQLEEMSYEELQCLLQQLEQQAEQRRQQDAADSGEHGEAGPSDEVTEEAAPHQRDMLVPKVCVNLMGICSCAGSDMMHHAATYFVPGWSGADSNRMHGHATAGAHGCCQLSQHCAVRLGQKKHNP
jgi:hypothetical protein